MSAPSVPSAVEEGASGSDVDEAGAPARSGTVYLVGAGPGDPGLLTVRARELLDSCDAIVYDALANPEVLAGLDAASEQRGAIAPERHFVGKRGGDGGSARQDDINALLVRLGREGKRVVRLKGGDPFVFGRGSEEAQALAAAGVAFEVVPGVTAGIAAPAYAGIPVTHRAVATSVTFVTGHEDPSKERTQTDWEALARAGGTIVLYMGVKRLPAIAAALTAGGLPADTPAAAVQWGTYGRQRTVVATLDTLAARAAEAGVEAPVITVIGPAVALREEIAWFDRRPLFGRRVLVTRARARAGSLAERLRALGADVTEAPATRIEPLDQAPLRRAVARLADYQWAVFTSQNAVTLFWEALRAEGRDARALAGVTVCAVGPATGEALLARGIAVDVVPRRFVAEGLLEALDGRGDLQAARVLYTTAQGARDVLPEGLAALGADVDVVRAYRSVPDAEGAATLRAALERGEVDLVTLTSASAVHAYVDAVGAALAGRAPAASIGPITSEAARSAGLAVAAEAEESTIPGLVEAVLRWRESGAGRGK
ncbi:MAG: uroporphyrinogen-III C-methyltransferase [Gemmatimonadaceae bacterium]